MTGADAWAGGSDSAALNPFLGFGRLQYGQYRASLGTSVPQRGQLNDMTISSRAVSSTKHSKGQFPETR